MIKKLIYYMLSISFFGLFSCSKDVEFHSDPYQQGKEPLGIVIESTQKPAPETGGPGTLVKFKVTGLTNYKEKAIFTFNGQKAEIVSITDGEITVKVPEFASTGKTTILIDDIVFYGPNFTVLGKVQLDPTWQAKYGVSGGSSYIADILTTIEDKRVLVGDFSNYENKGNIKPNNRIVRTFRNGEYDASFRVGNGSNGSLNSIIQIQNAYYIAGNFSGFDQRTDNISNLTRINLNGQIDTMEVKPFRPPHLPDTLKYYPKFNGGFNQAVFRIFQHRGKILAVGDFRFHIHRIYGKPNYMETRDSVILDSTEIRSVALLNLDGTLDKTFRFSGNKALSGANGFVNAYYHETGALKGKTVVYGKFSNFDGQAAGNIVRLNEDGTVDKTFNIGTGANFTVSNVTYNDKTGKYVLTGGFKMFNNVNSPYLILLNSNGSIDNTFKVKSFGTGSAGYAKQLDDGLIVVSGGFKEYNGIARSGFMILDSKGDLVKGMNNSGLVQGYISKVIETKSDDGKRALLLLGGFSKFDNVDARGITRITIE